MMDERDAHHTITLIANALHDVANEVYLIAMQIPEDTTDPTLVLFRQLALRVADIGHYSAALHKLSNERIEQVTSACGTVVVLEPPVAVEPPAADGLSDLGGVAEAEV